MPESAAQAKAAAAAKAAEDAALNQTPQNRNEAKMPPVGNFAVPASSNKESKKRPRNNNSTVSGSQTNVIGESSRGVAQGGPSNKVRLWCLHDPLYICNDMEPLLHLDPISVTEFL